MQLWTPGDVSKRIRTPKERRICAPPPPCGISTGLFPAYPSGFPAPLTWTGIWHYVSADVGVSGGGTSAYTWLDQTANNHNWNGNGGGGSPGWPTLVSSAINGRPACYSAAGNCGVTMNNLPPGPSFYAQSTTTIVVQSTSTAQTAYGVLYELHNLSGFIIDVSPSGTAFDFAMSSAERGTLTGGNPNVLNTPHIIVITYDWSVPGPATTAGTGTRKFYIDGVLIGTATSSNSLLTPGNEPPTMWSYDATGTYGWTGYIGALAIQVGHVATLSELLAVNFAYMGAKYTISV